MDPGGAVTRVLDCVSVSNGLDWAPDGSAMYYADSATGIAFALTKNRLAFNTNAAEQVAAIVTEEVGGR